MHKFNLSAVHLHVHHKYITSVLATEYPMVLAQSSQKLSSLRCSTSHKSAFCLQHRHSVRQGTSCIVVWVTTRFTASLSHGTRHVRSVLRRGVTWRSSTPMKNPKCCSQCLVPLLLSWLLIGSLSASTTCTMRASTSLSSVRNRFRRLLNNCVAVWISDFFTEVYTAQRGRIAQLV